MNLWRAIGLAIVAAAAAIIAAFSFGDTLREWTRDQAGALLSLLEKPADDARVSYRSEDDVGKRDEQAGQAAAHEANVQRATGLPTSNFEEVGQKSHESSLWRLSRGVGRLVITDPKEGVPENINICTGTLISESYILTAAHCFFRNPDRGWGVPARPTRIEFQLGYLYAGQSTATDADIVRLAVELQPVELACPEAPCRLIGQPEMGYDFAILKLKPHEIDKATAAKFGPVKLGDVKIFKDHPFVIFQHPLGTQLMVTERHCVGMSNVEGDAAQVRARQFFGHFCDTLNGSSGAPVFSRDHEVVTGVHVQGQRGFNATERENQTAANGAVHISAVAGISQIIGEQVEFEKDPPTAEQNILINAANERGEQAERLLAADRGTVAAYVALDALRGFIDRADSDFLIDRSNKAQAGLIGALSPRRELFALRGHTDKVNSAHFSPDGTRIVTASLDGSVRVWNSQTGAPLLSWKVSDVHTAAFSPDGQRVVTGEGFGYSDGGRATVWDAKNGKLLLSLRGHRGKVVSATYSHDGTRILTACWGGDARVWNAKTGALLLTLLKSEGLAPLIEARFSPDGRRIVTVRNGSSNSAVWDSRSGAKLHSFDGFELYSAAFSHDGTRVVTSGGRLVPGAGGERVDVATYVWDAETWTLTNTLGTNTALPKSASFSPDGASVVTAFEDGTTRIWSLDGFQEPRIIIRGHSDKVNSVAYSPDGAMLLTSSDDGTARIWQAEKGGQLLTLADHTFPLTNAKFSLDGTRVVTNAHDATTKLWDVATGSLLLTINTRGASDASLSADGRRVVTTGQTTRIWSATNGAQLLEIKHHFPSTTVAFSPNGLHMVTGLFSNAIVWDVVSGEKVVAVLGHYEKVNEVAYFPDGSRFATASSDKTASVWDATTGELRYTLRGHEEAVVGVAISRDNSRIATTSWDHSVRIWDGNTGALVLILDGFEGRPSSASFSPDGKRIVVTSDEVRVWDAVNGVPLYRLVGHKAEVVRASFAARGELIVTASKDHTARLWRAWPGGSSLVRDGQCRLRLVKPSVAECTALHLNCGTPRPPPSECNAALGN